MMRVENIISNNGNMIPNQFIIDQGDKVTFQSYRSQIIDIDYANNELVVYPDYAYSRTTGKYRNKFLDDQGFYEVADLQSLNKAIKDGKVSIRGTEWKVRESCQKGQIRSEKGLLRNQQSSFIMR